MSVVLEYTAINLQVIPKQPDGSPAKSGKHILNVAKVLATIISALKTKSLVKATLAIELSKKLFETKEDTLVLQEADYILIKQELEKVELHAWVLVDVNADKVLKESKELDI